MLTNVAVVAAAVFAVVMSSPARAAGMPGDAKTPERVTFESGGERIVGLLYLPAAAAAGEKPPVVVVAPPWLNVKEQVATRYARALADRGVAALAFDYRHWGESGGEPREFESASAKVDDLRAAVAFLKTRDDVAAERIGLLGICFGAGHALSASAGHPDVKSVATVAAWLHDAPSLRATFGAEEVERRYRVGKEARAKYASSKQVDYVPGASNTDKTAGMFSPDPSFFYTNAKRGAIKAWTNRMAVMSWVEWLDLDGVAAASKVTAPLLVVHSDGSSLPENARRAHATAKGPKELYWTEGDHLDFYDEPAHVEKATDAVAAHFRRTLGGSRRDAAAARNLSAVREFLASLEAKDLGRFLAVWADDGVQEMPFAPDGFPKRLEGKAAIARQYGGLPANFESMRFPLTSLRATDDPRVVIAEYKGDIRVKATGGKYDNTYIGVFEVNDDGKLNRFVEYFDPIALARAFGDPEKLKNNFNASEAAR